jgi:CheY-like chemotaxis protein
VLVVATNALRQLGYDPLAAEGGETALQILAEKPGIDVLFTDFCMPKMDGLELAKKAKETLPNLRVLIASGYPMQALRDKHRFAAEFAFIPKPYRLIDLADKLLSVKTALSGC